MCGLAGIFDQRDTRPIDGALLERMGETLRHRGPDGDGLFRQPGIGLAHRRLSIIDLSRGHQPMTSDDGAFTVAFNGEIYNFADLKEELVGRGRRFNTHCDTEVILQAWSVWGPACIDRFRGMFAFALWDAAVQTLHLVRDRLGKKPLYYCELADGHVIFGSELKALMAHPGLPRTIDPRAVEDFFAFGYVPDPKSIYSGVNKLPPGHRLELKRGAPSKLVRYWRLSFGSQSAVDEDSAVSRLETLLDESVRLRRVSDVPIGAFLSGGVDSSGVVAVMARQMSDPVNTFSISFGQKDFDESAYAEEVARLHRTQHHQRLVDPDNFDLVDRLIDIYDEPFGDSSALPTFRVCAVASEFVKVCLSGDGGDELFAGYRRYLWHQRESRVRDLLPDSIRIPLFSTLARAYPKLDQAPRIFRAKTTFKELAMNAPEAFFHSVSVMSDSLRQSLFSAQHVASLQGYRSADEIARHMAEADTDDPLFQAQYTDFQTWLPGDILVKVDRASMANSLEVRAPLLDHVMAEWAATLPSEHKLRGGSGKHVLKRVVEKHVPSHVIHRPKQGFSVPLDAWFRGPLKQRVRETVTRGALLETGLFEPATLDRLVAEHESGARNHGAPLWLLLMFEAFIRRSNDTSADLAA